MNANKNRRHALILILGLLTACSPKAAPQAAPDLSSQIQQAVSATLTAIPTRVQPSPVPSSPPTQASLAGVFCEYQFCIGHPTDLAFYDVSAQQNPLAPSSYGQGMLAAIQNTLFVQVVWQSAPGAADPEFMLDLILDEEVDTRSGALEVKLIRNLNLTYTEITTTATSLLPFGAAAAWICNDRAFAWKVYSPQAETIRALFDDMFAKFRCES